MKAARIFNWRSLAKAVVPVAVIACVWLAACGAMERERVPAATSPGSANLAAVPEDHVDAQAELHVFVVEASTGDPIAGLAASLVDPERGWDALKRESRDAGGLLFAELPLGEPLLLRIFTHTGGRELGRCEVEPLQPGERRELTVEIDANRVPSYWFRVTAGADGRPLEGVRFTDLPVRGSPGEAVHGVTDSAGLVGLGTPFGTASLALQAEGFAPAHVSLRRGGPSADAATWLELEQPARLDIHMEARGGVSVAGRTILVHASGYELGLEESGSGGWSPSSKRWGISLVTDADGWAHFESLPTTRAFAPALGDSGVRLHVGLRKSRWEFSDLVPDGLRLEPGERRELMVPLGREATVVGRVVDQFGAALADRELVLARAREVPERKIPFENLRHAERKLWTDGNGRFEIPGVPAGRWELCLDFRPRVSRRSTAAAVSEDAVLEEASVFEVDGFGDTVELLLTAKRGLSISGVLLGAGGEPVTDALVVGASSEVGHSTHARPGTDGRFVLGPLLEATYALTVNGPGTEGGAPVSARPGDDVTLQMPALGSLHLLLVGEPDPLARAVGYAWARVDGNGLPLARRYSSTETPAVTIRDTAEGQYLVTAWTHAGRFALAQGVQVVGNETAEIVELQLERGGRVRVTVLEKLEGVKLILLRSAGAQVAEAYLRGTEPHVLSGPAGDAVLELWVDGELRESHELELIPGRAAEVELGAG